MLPTDQGRTTSISTAEGHRQNIEHHPQICTLADAIRVAGQDPVHLGSDRGIILLGSRDDAHLLTYPALWDATLRIAAALRDQGVRQGDRVILLLPTSEGYVVTLCAAIVLGVIPCTMAAPTTRGKLPDFLPQLDAVVDKLAPALVIAPPFLEEALQTIWMNRGCRVVTPEQLAGTAPLDPDTLPLIDPDHPHHVQLTSGSTQRPKAVLLSHSNVLANIQASMRAVNFDPAGEIGVSWLPLYHDMGLVQLLITIYYQASIALMSPFSFLRDPLSWLRYISQYHASLSAAPTFAYRLCIQKFNPQKVEGIDLSSWRHAFIGAEPISRSIVEDFTRCFQPYGFSEETMYPCYGMAETVLATTLPRTTNTPLRRFGFVSVDRIDPEALRVQERAAPCADDAVQAVEVVGMGHPVDGLEVVILDDHGRRAEREVGEICVRGSSLMQQYLNDPERTAQAMRSGWYRTGDRGYLVDGELYVLGRIKELLIVRGRNYEPYDIEAALEQLDGVREGYTVVFGLYNDARGTDDVIAVVETKLDGEEQRTLVQSIQEILQRHFGFLADAIICVPHGTVPRTTSGKRQRALCQQWYREGKLHQTGVQSGDPT